MAKRTVTLNLSDRELEVLDELCAKRDLTKTALLKQALRLYQAVNVRLERGERLTFENLATHEKSELVVL